jgi:hypothetical protein
VPDTDYWYDEASVLAQAIVQGNSPAILQEIAAERVSWPTNRQEHLAYILGNGTSEAEQKILLTLSASTDSSVSFRALESLAEMRNQGGPFPEPDGKPNVREQELTAIAALGSPCDCGFCSKHEAGEGSPVEPAAQIFHEPHEAASFGCCSKCETPYLMYWVASRDDAFQYHCPLSPAEYGTLRESATARAIIRKEVLDMIRMKEVFFTSPWESKWVGGWLVLVEPRPW